jgi:hypothetical protein
MAQLLKHVGLYGEKPCVVVFRELPEEPDNALICISNSLEGQLHDDVMSVVDSHEGQESNNISEVLFRRRLSDGENMLEALHSRQKLTKVPVNMVTLTPLPNQSVPLEEVNKELKQIENGSNPALKTETDPQVLESTTTTADMLGESVPEGEDKDAVAKNLLTQAELLEEDAKAIMADAEAKKAEAYSIAPDLAPKKGPGRPKKVV